MEMPQLPSNFQYNNKMHRYGHKDKLWAIGYEWVYKSNVYKTICYGDWSEGTSERWKSYQDKDQSPGFKKREKDALKEISESVDLDKQIKHRKCAELWSKEWDNIPFPKYIHPYLEKKLITNSYGSKIDINGALIIRIFDENGIVGVQKIFNPGDGFIKRFSTGIKKKGSLAQIGDFQDQQFIYVAEGFATAASIHMATNMPVAICIDSGNMFDAIVTLRKINSRCKVIICADVDKNQIGIKKANACKAAFTNCIVKIPKFAMKNDKQTDFNDLHVGEGIEEVKKQLEINEDEFIKIIPMGYLEDKYCYTSSINNQLIWIPSAGHTDKNLYRLAPHEYWTKFHKSEKTPWTLIASDLMNQCHDKGIFDPERIRGKGAWLERNSVVINDGKNTPKSDEYYYQKMIQTELSGEPYSNDDMKTILDAFEKVRTSSPCENMYLASWLIQAQIFACIPWRFHLWLTGEAGSGKSHIMKWIVDSIPLSLFVNNATAAGIRQEIKNNATAVCYDESEPDQERINAIIEMARQSSTNGGAKMLRGSASGESSKYNAQCIFMLGSIQTNITAAADKTRFMVVELLKSSNKEDFAYMTFTFESIDPARFFQRAVKSVPGILESIRVAKNNLLLKGVDSRQADQLSSVLACFHAYKSINPMTNDECDLYLMDYDLIKSEYRKINETDEAERCISEIMTLTVNNKNETIAYCINKCRESIYFEDEEKSLASFGIRILPRNEIFIASKSNKLINAMKRYPDYSKIITRNNSICVAKNIKKYVKGYSLGMVHGFIVHLVEAKND